MRFFLSVLILVFSFPALAVEVSLSVPASREVRQDEVIATLNFRTKALKAAEAQDALNKKMKEAMDIIKNVTSVKVATGYYNVWQDYQSKTWEATQQIELTSINRKDILDLVGQLQSMGFETQGVAYRLSQQARDAMTNDLIAQALKTARERADVIAKSLGLSLVRVVGVRHDVLKTPDFHPKMDMMMARSAMAEAASAPVVEADDERVSLSLEVDFVME